MIVRSIIWRGVVVLCTLALTLPVWMQSSRADPLYLLPLIGWTTLAFVGGPAVPKTSPTQIVRTIVFAAVAIGALTWAASGTIALGQIAILALCGMPLAFLHRWIANDRLPLRRIVLHALPVILWVPVGTAIADASYRWPASAERPHVMLLSSLPLVWGSMPGGAIAGLSGESAPASLWSLLGDGAQANPIDHVTPDALQSTSVLLLIQPRLLPPESMIAIDDWVRGGGHIVWLADPSLEASYDFPLGDRRNPEISEPNVVLLRRWGLNLVERPRTGGGTGRRFDGNVPLLLKSPGQWESAGSECQLRSVAVIAECRIGRGRAVLIADADMADAPLWTRADTGTAHHPIFWTAGNGQWVLATVRRLAGADENWRSAEPVWLRPALSR